MSTSKTSSSTPKDAAHKHAVHTDATPAEAPENGAARPDSAGLRGDALVARIKELIHEGTVRRIVVKNDEGHTVLEIPVAAGVIAAVAAPIVTAVSAIAALANDWKIEVYRKEQ